MVRRIWSYESVHQQDWYTVFSLSEEHFVYCMRADLFIAAKMYLCRGCKDIAKILQSYCKDNYLCRIPDGYLLFSLNECCEHVVCLPERN